MNLLPKLLVVEDDRNLREILCIELEYSLGCQAIGACGVTQALELLATHDVDVIVSDFLMGDGNGLDLVLQMREAKMPEIPVVVMTGLGADEVSELPARGVAAVVRKPFMPSDLVSVVDLYLAKRDLVAS